MIKYLLNKYKSLSKEVKASSAYTFCSVLQRCLSFITLPLFTRLLTTTQYGQSTVYSSWVGILTIFITLNLPYGSFQTAMVKYKNTRIEYTSSISFLFCILGLVFLVVYLPFHIFWNQLFELPLIMMVIMTIEIVFTGVTDCWLSKNRFEFKYKSVILFTLSKAFLSPILAFFLVVFFDEKGFAKIIGYSTINILFGVVLFIIIIINGKTFYNRGFWMYAFSFNIPLIPYYISQMVFNISDRIMISHICGTDKAAIYGVAYSLAVMLNFLIIAINGSYSPWFIMQLDSGKGDKNRLVSLNLSVIIAVGLWLIVTMAPEIILIMAGKEYELGIWAVPPVAISVLLLFYTGLFDRILFLYEKKYFLLLDAIVPCIVNVVLNLIFIPKYGFVAASYTTLVSYIIFATITYFMARNTLREKNIKQSLFNLKGLFVIFIIMCSLSALVMALYNNLIVRLCIVFMITICSMLNRKKIIKMLKMET